MIVYQNTARGFMLDVDSFEIVDKIKEQFKKRAGKINFNRSEEDSWINSLDKMERIIRNSGIADDCGVLVEFGLPSTSKRIDFIIAGRDEHDNENFIIVELKQWTEAESTDKEDVVVTPYFGRALTTHPSYQASSYKSYLSDFNENVYSKKLYPYSCAYLHNYVEKDPEPLKAANYAHSVSDSPLYFRHDHARLQEFICRHVGKGRGTEILYEIESGNIRPSKQLVDHVTGLFKGNREFILLEEQKVAYEVALKTGLSAEKKTVIIINGGPGTGKSVVSMSLLGSFLKKRKNVFFVAPNASFRETLVNKLTQGKDTRRAKLLLTGSSKYYNVPENSYDILVIDEAHRLKNSQAFMYQGENQVADLINAAKVSVFFVDNAQMIRPQDIGSDVEIRKQAGRYNARIIDLKLETQFRCDGAEGYVNWIDDVLEIDTTGNFDGWDKKTYDFFVADSPNTLREWVNSKVAAGFNARLLAGYAWPWTSAKNGNLNAEIADVNIPEHDFAMPWNSRQIGSSWATNEKGLGQVGCVHTSQGLEFDYVGVIVGKDLQFRFLDKNGNEINPTEKRNVEDHQEGFSHDEFYDRMVADPVQPYDFLEEESFVQGEFYSKWENYFDIAGKQGLNKNPEKMNQMIRNIYRILLTRGIKGCGVYFCDSNLERYFRFRLSKIRM